MRSVAAALAGIKRSAGVEFFVIVEINTEAFVIIDEKPVLIGVVDVGPQRAVHAEHIALISRAMAVAAMLIGDEAHHSDTVIGQFGNVIEIGKETREGEAPIIVAFGGRFGFGGCFCGGCLRFDVRCAPKQRETQGKAHAQWLV